MLLLNISNIILKLSGLFVCVGVFIFQCLGEKKFLGCGLLGAISTQAYTICCYEYLLNGKLFILWDNKNNIRNFQEKSKENRKIVRYGLETTLSLIWKVETILITVMWHQNWRTEVKTTFVPYFDPISDKIWS